MSTDTITQKTASSITLESGATISARRMKWGAATKLLRLIPQHLTTYAPLFFAKDEAGNAVGVSVDAILPKLGQMIGSVEELTTFVLLNGTNITPEQLSEDLEFHQGFELIAAALELNAGDDLKNSCAGIGKTLSGLVSATPRKTSTAASTPTSAGTVSAPTT